MPIVFGLGKNDAWNDPLNVYGGKAETSAVTGQNEASKFALSDVDKNDLINTLIAEAGGEGEQGMAAVASVIRNRAESRGKSPADIIREPKQFTGYEAPGEGARKAMQDPEMRSRAETILNSVLAGELPDPTGGADHYHADYVSPDWAGKMPQTAKIGQHIFYRDGSRKKNAATAYAPGLDASKATDPFDAVLRGDATKPTSTPKKAEDDSSLLLSRLQPGKPQTYITDMAPEMRSGLTAMFSEAPDFVRSGLDILSGARTPEKQAQIIADNAGKYGFDRGAWLSDVKAMGPVEAGKKWRPTFRDLGVTKNIGMPGGSKHQHGTATDLGWNGGAFSTAPKEVREWVHANASKYGLAFPMAHEPWHIETANARGGGAVIAEATGGQAGKQFASFGTGNVGKSIVVDGSFAASDPMGLMGEGPNPFAQLAAAEKADQERQQTQQAQGFEDQRIAALNDRHNREVEQAAASVPGGRFQAMTEQDAGTFQQDWKDKYQSQGRATDFSRNIGIGTVQLGQGIDNMMRVLIDKVPGGEWLNQKIDDIDRWMLDGQTIGEGMKDRVDFLSASRTERGQEAAAKTVFKPDSWELGGALSDPDWYLAQTAQSLPSMAVTMAPSFLLARGAYTTAIAAGATERAAAASAAKMATVAGGISEGIIGGAQTAQSIREKIAAMPREDLLQSDAVKQLIADGKSEDEAIKAVSDDAQVQGLITAGVATGIFGGLGDRALAKIIGEGVSGNIAKRAAGGFVRGAVAEGVLEETPQNVAQTIAENAAMKRANPDQKLFEGTAEAAASGLAVGGTMGGVMGGVGGAASPQRAETATGAKTTQGNAPEGSSTTMEQDQAAAPTASGPIGRSVQHAEQQIASRQPAPAPEGAPEVGATVRVDAEGLSPFMGTVDSYEGSEAVVIDGGSGEVYQIPIANLTKLASAEWDGPAGRAAPPLPEYSADPALEPASPQASETVTGPLPPASEQKAATERFPSAPTPGQRVIVDDERGGRFPATVRSYENGATEALVVTDDGKDLQVPVSSLAVSKLTGKQVEAQRLKIDPAVDRSEEIAGAGPNARRVNGRTVVFPDERHARLFQHSIDRQLARRMGASQLDLAGTDATTMKQLAEDFGVTTQAVETMADDYRYRVLRAAKTANSDLPQRVAPVNERLLKRWQSERAKQDPAAQSTEQTAAHWWDVELTSLDRKRILDAAGVKRNEAAMWSTFTPAIKAKIEAQRVRKDGAEGSTFTTAKGSTYTLHFDGTTTRNKAARDTPGHEGDSGIKPRTAKTIFLDTNAAVLSSAGMTDVGGKGARVTIRDGKATLVTWNKQQNGWGASPDARNIPFATTPKVGAYPLELWDAATDVPGYEAYARMHAGNEITEILMSEDAADLVDAAAHEAATSPENSLPEPSQAQKEAGNYKLGHIRLGGLDISIENPAGSERKGVDPGGKAWSVKMKSHYGYIKGTVGRDKDHIDIFVRPGTQEASDASMVYVVDQQSDKGSFDEHKVLLGFDSEEAAKAAYLENYTAGWTGLRAITPSTLGDFKTWLATGDTQKPFAPKWFGSRDKAETYLKRQKLTETHEVVERNKRFEIRETKNERVPASDLRVGDERGASAPSAAQDRADVERRQESNPPRPEERNDATGSSARSGGEDVPAAARRADNDKTLKPAFDASKYAWDYVWNSESDAISDALSRLSSTSGGDQAIVDLIRSGATDAELLNFIGAQWGIGGAGGNRYMVETSAGPTVTVTLEKDDGKKRIVLKGPKLAKALRDEFNVSLDEMKAKVERAQETTKPEKRTKAPAVSENTIFTADAAERARALLRSKLNQLNSGIDPEIMQAGIVLAGYHIERGARTFAAFASAMLSDLGEVARPYLKSWYMGVKYDPRAGAFDGMSSAAEVDAADVDAIEVRDEPAKLEDDGKAALEGAPSGEVSPVEGSGDAGSGTGSSRGADLPRDGATGSERVQPGRGVADDARAIPASARRSAEGNAKPDAAGDGRSSQRSKDDASAVGDEGPFGPILRGFEGKWRDAAAELERRKNGDAVGALHHRDVGAIDLPWGKAGTNRHNGAGLAKLIAWHPEVLVDLQAFIDRLHVDREASSARRIQLRDETGQAGIRLDYDGVAKTWLLTAFEAGKRRSEPSNLTLSEIWEGKFAGRDASPGTVPNEPSDAGWSRRTGKDNVPDPLQNVQSAAVPAQKQPVDFTISAEDQIGQGGAKTKFANNVAAVKLLATLRDEARAATRDEQAVLAKWVGWGGLREAFYREDGSVSKGWEKQAAELKALLSDQEYRAAEASTRNAHYTASEVVTAMWNIAGRLGFQGGKVLEPSVGAGNFLGLMPGEFRTGAAITGVELDHITGGIAMNLYPQANIQAPVGFEAFSMPDGYFDLAIGNPPFGSERLYDKSRRHLNKLSIHNFFFAKSIEGLRPGGVLAMVVTNRFLDGNNAAARKMIAKQADLVGAIRLPNNAFLKNAGTEVTTDIVLLQKRKADAVPGSTAWTETDEYRGKDGKPVPLNRYFIENPEMMLGDFGAFGTMYGPDEPALVAKPGSDLPAEIAKAIERLPSAIMDGPGAQPVIAEQVAEGVNDVHVGSMFLSDGTVHQRVPDSLGNPQSKPVEFANDKAMERVSGMIRLRDVFARLRRAQIDPASTERQIENLRAQLNKAYDSFVKAHGPVNADGNKRLFRDDPTWPQISALENNFDKGISPAVAKSTGEKARLPSAEKAPIFSKRTQQPYHPPIHAESAKDALAQTLNERGRVDMAYMRALYGKTDDAIAAELGPLLFKQPNGSYEVADAYLSGNVKAKLAEAERAAEADSDFRRNVAALRDVLPADIEAVDIDVKPGAPWVPGKHVADFINHITQQRGATAFYSTAQGQWSLDVPRAAATAETMWATDRAGISQIVTAALNGKSAQVYARDANGNPVIDQAATDAANEKVERVKTEWQRWLWDDDARRDELTRLYNDTFNTDVVRVFDGAHLSLPGKVSDDIITLRPHQKSFVWRTLQSSVALADHTVGAGKTFALIASIMEKRRTGQARKPLLTVPNHLVGQWAADFVKLYPGAKVLAATKRDFEKESRKRLMARITTGDWDVVILAHSQFGLIGVAPETEAKFIEQQIADLESSIKEMRRETGEKSRNVAQMAKQRQNLESKLKGLLDAGRKDDGLYFDDLGVDALYVDEFHEFKNLPFVTGMQRVAGLGNPAGSKKATDMYLKIQQITEATGGNVVVATGTPLSNTMAEMYTLQRYLSPKKLISLGLAHFDAWARVFGDVVTDWELSPSGQYKLNTRFARFVNIPELMTQYLSFADVISNDDIKAQLAAQGKTLPLPKVKGGKPTNITVERSADQASFIGEGSMAADGTLHFPQGSLVWRAENLPKKAEKGADNMLKVMSDARKAALDMRLIDASYADNPASKVNRAADEMQRIYRKWADLKGTQLVFIDLSTPKKAKAKEEAALRELIRKADEGDEAAQEKLDAMSPDEFLALDAAFSVYDDLKQKLIDRGVPANEIAFIHDANTELQKEELFGKVRSGRVRFLFGSTAKMGAGTNVQNRLVALHHLDAPWRPSDLEQRDGRIVRQGNELYAADPEGFEVEILRYATKNTLDARQWQGIEAKARFIGQVRKGDVKTRVIEDIAGEAANAAEMKAAASGNPLILEEMETRRRLRQLEGQATEHEREQHRIKRKMRDVEAEREMIASRMDAVKADADSAAAFAKEPFTSVVFGNKVDKPKEFGAALLSAMRQAIIDGVEKQNAGKVGAFKLSLQQNFGQSFNVLIAGAEEYNVTVSDVGEQDATGLAMQIINTIKRLQNGPTIFADRAAELEKQAPALERQLGPWPLQQELADTSAKHRRLIDALKPKAKPATAGSQQANQQEETGVLEPIKAKRPDPEVAVRADLVSMPAPQMKDGQTLLDWASSAVLDKGRETGNEYLIAIDDDGALVEFGTAHAKNAVGLSKRLGRAMANPDRRLVIYHNHPSNRPVSVPDITQVAFPGVHAVWALGHGGKNTRIAASEDARQRLRLADLTPSQIDRLSGRILEAMRKVQADIGALLQERVNAGVISEDDANAAHVEAIPMIAANAGLIDYQTNEIYDPSAVPGLESAIDDAALEIARTLLDERRAKKIADARVRGPAVTVRHIGELERVAGRYQQVGTEQSGPRALHEGSAGSYSAKDAGRVTQQRVVRELKGRLTDLKPAILKAIPLNYFTELARPNMVAVSDYMRVKRMMDAYRGELHAEADKLAGEWLKYARLGWLGKDKSRAQELSDLMHQATLAGVDPSSTDKETQQLPGYDILRKRYMALPPAGRALYQRVRDAYAKQAEELDEILLESVKKAQRIAADRAEERYKKTLQKIRDAGLSPLDRRKAEEDAESAYKAEKTKSTWAAKARMTKLRIAFESSRVPAPYFPLGRFGRYFVTVRGADGAIISFSKFEKAADQQRFFEDVTEAYPKAVIEKGVMEDGADLRRSMDPRMVAEIETMLGDAGIDSQIMDQIWQRYLETMPDISTRKRFIHRKGTRGYSRDALRVFSSHMFHAAHQMAKVKYGLELQDLVKQTREQAREADDQNSAMTLANELASRHSWVMNPTGGKVAQVMTSAAFVWYLAASPAAAVVNMTQTAMMGIPILGARFGGIAKAAAALANASRDSLAGRGSVRNAKLRGDEAAAMEAFYDSGLIDRTQSHDLAGVGETGVEYTPLRARAMAVISWAFHRAEVWNREVTALAAYRLARKAGQDYLAAVDTAHDLTWKTHFDYSNSSRPALMQNDFAKVALVFRQHNINMLYRVFRDVQQSLSGETAQARKEARYQLAGIMGMMSLMAGVTGTFGFNLAMALAGMVFGDDDDPLDFAERFKADMVDILEPELGGVVPNGVPGHYLGVDLSNRIGMPDLWFRSPTRDLQGKDEYQYWLSQSLGATVSLGEQLFTGVSLILEGEAARGIEMMSPKVARDLMKSYRYASEGLTTVGGDKMMSSDQIGWHGAIAQAMGFTPATVSETWDRNTALKNAERGLLDERQKLVNKFAMAAMEGDKDAVDDAISAITKWNTVPIHQPIAIKKETLERSIKTRARNDAKREDGTLISNQILGLRLREQLAERVY